MIETPAHDVPPDIQRAQLEEVRRRIAEVEPGEVTLIPGDQMFAEVRRMVKSAHPSVDGD